MNRLKQAANCVRHVAPALVGLWLLQAALAAWLAEPLFRAGAPLQDDELFEGGALMLAELALTRRQELLSALGTTAPRTLMALLGLSFARYHLMRLVARHSGLLAAGPGAAATASTALTPATPAWLDWGKGAVWYLGLSGAHIIALLGVMAGASLGLLQLERFSQGTLPSSVLIGASLLALGTSVVLLLLSVVTRLAQLQLISHARAGVAFDQLLSTLRRHFFSLTTARAGCGLATTTLALIASLASSPASSQALPPWLMGFGIQLLLLLSLALETLWLAFAAHSSPLLPEAKPPTLPFSSQLA